MKEIYLGPIKSKRQAESLARRLEKVNNPVHRDAAKLLRRSWKFFAARPKEGEAIVKLAMGQ